MSESTSVETRAIEAYHDWKKVGSEATATSYNRHIRRFQDYLNEHTDVGLFDCHSGHTEQFYQYLKDEGGYAPSTIRVSHAALGDFYDAIDTFGGQRGFPDVSVDEDPTEHTSPERLDGMHTSSKKDAEGGDRPLDVDEIGELVDNVPEPTLRNELIVRLLYQTGVRVSELSRIKLEHIDRDRRRISIYGVKTDEQRKVWYQPSLDTLLSLWIDGDRQAVFHAEGSSYLFPTTRAEHISEKTINQVVREAAESAGIQEVVYEDRGGNPVHRVTAHTLRKSFGVHFINDGGDISFLMELLGHNDIETTKENYLKYSEKDLEQSVRQYGPSL